MRGGAIPLYAWALVLAMLWALNWIWTGDAIQIGEFAFAVGVILAWGTAVLARGHGQALRTGEPPAEDEPEALPEASLASATAAFGVASILFGLVWSSFLVIFGAGLLIASLGRLFIEVRAERASRRAVISGPRTVWEERSQ